MSKFSSITVYYQNVRGLKTKTHETYCNISHCNYDLIIFTETWLNNSVLSSELFIDKYKVYRRDRNSSKYCQTKSDGGGVLIAVSNKIQSRRITQWESEHEDLWLTIEIPFNDSVRQLTFCAVYLPPPVNRCT